MKNPHRIGEFFERKSNDKLNEELQAKLSDATEHESKLKEQEALALAEKRKFNKQRFELLDLIVRQTFLRITRDSDETEQDFSGLELADFDPTKPLEKSQIEDGMSVMEDLIVKLIFENRSIGSKFDFFFDWLLAIQAQPNLHRLAVSQPQLAAL